MTEEGPLVNESKTVPFVNESKTVPLVNPGRRG